jgi:hypothetical protein
MRKFKSLEPEGLPARFDLDIFSEEPIVKVDESKERIVVSYTFPGFYISDDSRSVDGEEVDFKQVNVAKTGFLAESGKPLLPSFGRYVQIPRNYDFKVSVERDNPIQFDDVLILPAQERLTDAPDTGDMADSADVEKEFEYDRQFYSRDEFYPKDIVEVAGPFKIESYLSLLIHVRPLQYNPVQKKLLGFSNIIVTIDIFPKDEKEAEEELSQRPELDQESYGNLFLNPGKRIEERLVGSEVRPVRRLKPVEELWFRPEFLIIYHDTLKKAAEQLAHWKNMRGLITETVSIKTVGNTVDKIKAYVRMLRGRTSSRLRYVLLFGDVDMIKSEEITVGPYIPRHETEKVTDYYYATEKDPAGDKDYVFPWLAIGRIPARTANEGKAVVDQIISYEGDPPAESSYYNRMVFAAYFQDNNQDKKADRAYMRTMEGIREQMVTAYGFDVERVYVTNSPDPEEYINSEPVPPEVKNAMVDGGTATGMLISAVEEGQLMMAHRDHGDANGWSHPSFNKNHVGGIDTDVPTPFYSINCLTGKFDLSGGTESFAEKILNMKGGAPSLIAATRVSHTFLNDDLMKAQFDAMWGGVLPTFPDTTASYPVKNNRLGDILNYAKAYLPLDNSGIPDRIRDHFEIYHVVGDPTLELWREEPKTVKIRARLKSFNLHITLSTCPRGSVITIWYKGKLLKTVNPSSTYLKLSLRDFALSQPPPTRREFYVCFYAPGYRFRRVSPWWGWPFSRS